MSGLHAPAARFRQCGETSRKQAVSNHVSAQDAFEFASVRLGTGIAHICDIKSPGTRRLATTAAARVGTATGFLGMMSLVRLLGFTNLSCGCVTGHYRELATNREITYVEEKGSACDHQDHRRNHTLAPTRFRMSTVTAKAS